MAPLYVRIRVVVCGLLVLTCVAQSNDRLPADGGSVASQVDAAFELAVRGDADFARARRLLETLSAREVVPAIVQRLRNAQTQRGDVRMLAYTALAYHEAGDTEIGRNQLIAGLADAAAKIRRICCESLPAEVVAGELERMHRLLLDPSTPEGQKALILQRLAGWGTYASGALRTAEALLADRKGLPHVRASAAQAMLNIGGLARALEHFRGVRDRKSQRIVMGVLGGFLGRIDSECHYHFEGSYREERAEARELVLQTLKSPHEEVRLAAAEVLFGVYGTDFIVFHSETEYEWDAEIRAAIEALRKDANPRIEKGVQAYFALDLDVGAKRMLRKKRRFDKLRSGAAATRGERETSAVTATRPGP